MLERYNPILDAIKNLCPTAHMGGGAVRDTLLARPIRDIDLFLDVTYTDAAAKLLRSEFGFVQTFERKSYKMSSDPAVVRVATFEKADETIPICLIGLKQTRGMQDNLARFDFGLCMAGFDGDKVYTAPEYKRDVEQKTFTLYCADDQPQFNCSMWRFDKITADRYAGWRLVVPEAYRELAREYTFKKVSCYNTETNGWMFREVVGQPLLTPKAR